MKKAMLCLVFLLPAISQAEPIRFHKLSDEEWRNGVVIPTSEWKGEGVKGQDGNGGFYLSNRRAKIVSKSGIHVPPNVAAGIFINFSYSHPGKYQDFELSWRFPNETWSLRQGAHFQLDRRAGGDQKFFIPFSEIYSDRKIGVLKLALEGCQGCKLFLAESRIVGEREIEDYQQYVPRIISYVHREPPPKESIF